VQRFVAGRLTVQRFVDDTLHHPWWGWDKHAATRATFRTPEAS
jgi:hypothetical protein